MSMLMPKTQPSGPTAEEKAASTAAKEEKIAEAQARAGEDTDRLFRLFGARSALGIGGRMGISSAGR